MSSNTTFSVDFIPRKCKNDASNAILYARITVDGEHTELSIKDKIKTNDWIGPKESVRGNSIEVKSINEHIKNVRFRIQEKYRMLEDKGLLLTAESVKKAYLAPQAEMKGHRLLELLKYFEKIWASKLKDGHMKNFRTTIKYLNRFALTLHQSGDIYLSQIERQFIVDFEYYIEHNPVKEGDPCIGNGIAKHIQRVNRIFNWAVEDIKWLKENPFNKYARKLIKSKRKKLLLNEVIAISNKELLQDKLPYVRDLFIFSCYTGLAFADVMALSAYDLERDEAGVIWCKIYRTKSDELCAVPFLKKAVQIIDKYWHVGKATKGGTVFPRITNQEVNRYLKIIMEMFSILFDLTFHVARHTFAKTIALKNRIPLETVQIMLGHTKITTTQIYADVDEEKVMDDMKGLDDRLDQKSRRLLEGSANNTLPGRVTYLPLPQHAAI